MIKRTIFKLMWLLRVHSPVCYRLSGVYTMSTILPEQDFSVTGRFGHDIQYIKNWLYLFI